MQDKERRAGEFALLEVEEYRRTLEVRCCRCRAFQTGLDKREGVSSLSLKFGFESASCEAASLAGAVEELNAARWLAILDEAGWAPGGGWQVKLGEAIHRREWIYAAERQHQVRAAASTQEARQTARAQ